MFDKAAHLFRGISGISLAFAMRLLISLGATICSLSLIADEFSGRIVGVTDGDTITARTTTDTIKVRLSSIDTPERGKPFGTKAKQSLSRQVFGKTVTVNRIGEDRYGRTLGEIIIVGESFNVWLVRGGWAWWYPRYAPATISCVIPSKRPRRTAEGYR